MVESKSSKFFDYPEPRPGPKTPYYNPEKSNPVVKGLVLSILGTVVSSAGFIQNILWSNAGFGDIEKLSALKDYDPRYDPTVIPIAIDALESGIKETKQSSLDSSAPRFYSVKDFHSLYKSGRVSPTDIAKILLGLIRRDTSPKGKHSIAFLESNEDVILRAAEASSQRYKAGSPLGVLDGVPIAVKDEVDVEGYKTRLGTLQDHTPKAGGTSWCVKKWEEAGAINIGKTTMHELGLDTTNNNHNYGTPLNPYNTHYYTGGSSGGSGYAVGAGLVPIALGVDGGGSVRIPADYCGIYGLKTSHGRVSGHPTLSGASTNGAIGPIAANMDDIEAAYRVMAEPDPSVRSSATFPPPIPTKSRPKMLGVYQTWLDRADREVAAPIAQALEYFEKVLDYTIVDLEIPLLPEGQGAHAMTILAEIAGTVSSLVGLTPANKILLSVGSKTPAPAYIAAQKLRNLLMQHLASLYIAHPGLVIVTPTTPNAGWHISGGDADLKAGISDGNMSMRSMEYVWLANFCGMPSLSAPAGYADAKGGGKIPVSIMGMAEWGDENTLISWGRDCERFLSERGGGRQLPENYVDLLDLIQGGK
ncbi:MAG: hypothetical protein M1814_005248 [Vezdaea aestivalis]|nr:MAG: hypothetical protein M1814_005248 [Vezdaea aestivalis]